MATLTVADNDISCEMELSGGYCLVKDSTKPEKCTNEESQGWLQRMISIFLIS